MVIVALPCRVVSLSPVSNVRPISRKHLERQPPPSRRTHCTGRACKRRTIIPANQRTDEWTGQQTNLSDEQSEIEIHKEEEEEEKNNNNNNNNNDNNNKNKNNKKQE